MRARGEMDIRLNDRDFTMVPAIGALMEFEELTGVSAQELLTALSNGLPKARHMVAVVTVGIKYGLPPAERRQAPSFDTVAKWMQSTGFSKLAPIVFEFLVRALADDETIERLDKIKSGEIVEESEGTPSPQ